MRTLTAGIVIMLSSWSATAQDYGNLDTEFRIVIGHSEDFPPGFTAEITTTNSYPCVGYEIRSGVSWHLDTLSISIGGFLRPSPCYESMTPATGSLYMGDIGPGEYVLRIRYRGATDLHQLTVAEGYVAASKLDASFTRITSQ
jgi:hypothetical protein